ncbi:PaaI family thioesterase [Nocardia transvalensis]|uniref:PaaI family thioesterase n=1 Tax=Nocardia transvalensis TaxID=37333 RepID=UPI001893C644|nr:hotdog fold domain-containing protein [Nocardia transvalensis]MBF6327933.1 hypothetical protein [Nocardia transvalensis]
MRRADTITIPGHVHGYPGVAFGGYVAGLLAGRVGGDSLRVDFRRTVPVDTPVVMAEAGTLTSVDGTLLAQARSDEPPELLIPSPPSWAEAEAASAKSAAANRWDTNCYGCGVTRPPGRGLRLFPWGIRARNLIVAAWIPDRELAGHDGALGPENVWAAMDCPGAWAAVQVAGMRSGGVTAAMRVTCRQPVYAGEKYLSYAWPVTADGRKYTVGVALTAPDGTLCVLAEMLWIEPRP